MAKAFSVRNIFYCPASSNIRSCACHLNEFWFPFLYRPEAAGSHLLQQQALSIHCHLHWAASRTAAMGEAKQRGKEEHGKVSVIHFSLVHKHACVLPWTSCLIVKWAPLFFVFRSPCQCIWTSLVQILSLQWTSTLPQRKTHTISTSVEWLSSALSRLLLGLSVKSNS